MPRLLPRPLLALAVLLAGSGVPTRAVAQAGLDAETRASRRTMANTLLSLALPGTGQLRDGHDRGWGYLALEAVAWTVWLERRHRGGELRARYRNLAWNEGRIQGEARVDGDFPYYETLATWRRSGAFDAEPSDPDLQPETDPDTYNGSIWALAQGLFLPSATPEPGSEAYRRALAYYEERAYGEAFLWDWTENPEAQARLDHLIEESDSRFQQATLVLGAVLANHLASAVDAYLSTSRDIEHTSLRIQPAVSGPRRAWSISLHIGALP